MKKFFVVALIAVALALASVATACKEPEPEHVHDWEWIITKHATTLAEGQETETCKTCKATRGTKAIAKLQTVFPITIDNNTITIVDGRTNNTAGTQLDSAITTKFTTLFNHESITMDSNSNTVISRGLVITLRDDVTFDRYDSAPTIGNKLDVNFTFVLDEDIASTANRARFRTAMTAMLNLPYDGEIQREFPITGGAYTVIIKDGRTSEATETLEDLGVITKFEELLNAAANNAAYTEVAPRGLMVVIESGVDYARYKAIDGNTIGANLSWVLETGDISTPQFRASFTSQLSDMIDLKTFTQR